MIPEFKFKKKTILPKRIDIKEFVTDKYSDKRVRIAGAATAGILALGLAVLAVPEQKETKKEDIATYFQTAGITTQIDTTENTLQEQIVSMSKKDDAAMTGTTLAAAGFSTDMAVSGDAVNEEIAAEEISAAVVAAATQQAVAMIELTAATQQAVVTEVTAEPVRPQLVGFSNPGIANVEQYVNIRVSPKESADICGKLSRNTACEVISEADGWYEVVTNGVYGYIKAEYLITGEEAWVLADQLKYAYVKVITETLYVREAPTTESSVIGMVSVDQKLELLEEQAEWVKIKFDGKEGYLNKSYIAIEYTLPKGEAVKVEEKKTTKSSKSSSSKKTSTKAASDCSSIVEYATQFVGNPYVYGGTSLTKGTDCSGFTMSVYAKFGVYLPHSSVAQSKCGTKVSTSDMQPGDLVFYGSGRSINHVGLYIGGGKIVHASTEKTGIKISSAFYRTPVTVRRVK